MRPLISVLAGTGLVVGMAAGVGSGTSSDGGNPNAMADPAAAITDQWAATGGDHREQRHSPLNQINASNVRALGVAWYADLPERGGSEATLSRFTSPCPTERELRRCHRPKTTSR